MAENENDEVRLRGPRGRRLEGRPRPIPRPCEIFGVVEAVGALAVAEAVTVAVDAAAPAARCDWDLLGSTSAAETRTYEADVILVASYLLFDHHWA